MPRHFETRRSCKHGDRVRSAMLFIRGKRTCTPSRRAPELRRAPHAHAQPRAFPARPDLGRIDSPSQIKASSPARRRRQMKPALRSTEIATMSSKRVRKHLIEPRPRASKCDAQVPSALPAPQCTSARHSCPPPRPAPLSPTAYNYKRSRRFKHGDSRKTIDSVGSKPVDTRCIEARDRSDATALQRAHARTSAAPTPAGPMRLGRQCGALQRISKRHAPRAVCLESSTSCAILCCVIQCSNL